MAFSHRSWLDEQRLKAVVTFSTIKRSKPVLRTSSLFFLAVGNVDLEVLTSIHAYAIFGADVVQREAADRAVIAVSANHQVKLERTILF